VPLPEFEGEDLPLGVHRATLRETLDRFGDQTPARQVIGLRLERVWRLAVDTGHLARLVVFGSFVTTKPRPNDVDVFLLMENTFNAEQLLVRRSSSSGMPRRGRTSGPACSGCGAPRPWVAKRQPSSTGR
jgi:hypothetical protein